MAKKKFKTLSLEEGVCIAYMLNNGQTATDIGRDLDRSPSTILREIKNYSVDKPSKKNHCKFHVAKTCTRHHLCDDACNKKKLCRLCPKQCYTFCEDYKEDTCKKLCEPPYVCNGCEDNNPNCKFTRRIYDPAEADKKAREIKHNKATGYDYTDEELDIINALVSPLILNGQSPYAILVSIKADLDKNGISISKSTLYRMIDRKDLDCRNIDLPEQAKRRRPKSKKRNRDANAKVMIEKAGRMYEDYLKYIESHNVVVPQMDCVEGKKTDICALLTLFWPDTNVQIAFLLARHDAKHVVDALDKLEIMIGLDMFRRMLPAILTDNGQEFTDIKGMERSCTVEGELRTKIFFCDPNRSDQKGGCERNHRLMRRIIPKGKTSLDIFMQSDICLMMDHVNSYPRENLYGKSPYEIAFALYPQDFIDNLNFTIIPPAQVILKPSLLKQKQDVSGY